MAKAATKSLKIYAILLAAGQSSRFRKRNKLLAKIAGVEMVRRVAEGLLSGRADGVIVVTGFQQERILAALKGLEVRTVENSHFEYGLASSLRTGVGALPDDAQGAMICLADMPGLTSAVTDTLIEVFRKLGGEKIVYPETADGEQRNPVIWPRSYFDRLMSLTGDEGAKEILQKNIESAVGLKVATPEVLEDIDTPEDLRVFAEAERKRAK